MARRGSPGRGHSTHRSRPSPQHRLSSGHCREHVRTAKLRVDGGSVAPRTGRRGIAADHAQIARSIRYTGCARCNHPCVAMGATAVRVDQLAVRYSLDRGGTSGIVAATRDTTLAEQYVHPGRPRASRAHAGHRERISADRGGRDHDGHPAVDRRVSKHRDGSDTENCADHRVGSTAHRLERRDWDRRRECGVPLHWASCRADGRLQRGLVRATSRDECERARRGGGAVSAGPSDCLVGSIDRRGDATLVRPSTSPARRRPGGSQRGVRASAEMSPVLSPLCSPGRATLS